MDPITMMVASIGMQFFNNYANSDKNKEIQDKQREFQKAAAEHDFERMRKLQAESAKLALELEAEVHKERAEDINSNYDALLENFAHSFAIQNWPLNVLPFVMKGESFGSLFKGTTKSVNMHCIFTPSNCDWFNRMFYDDIDLRLEAEMNNNWNAQTTHPIVYYGGGWNRRTVLPHGISIPNLIDLDDIGLLETNLKNVPVMVVTPYFDPWLHFRVKIWGMGKDSEVPFRIDIPHGADIEFSKRIFSYDYNKDMKEEMTEDFINTTIEEFVPYMESLIGFVADKYFWGMYGTKPYLPSIIVDGNINESLKNNYRLLYSHEFKNTIFDLNNANNIFSFYDGIKTLYSDINKKNLLDFIFNQYFQNSVIEFSINNNRIYTPDFLPIIDDLLSRCNNSKHIDKLNKIKRNIIYENFYVEYAFCASVKELHSRISLYLSKYNTTDGVFKVIEKNVILLCAKKQGYLQLGDYLVCISFQNLFFNKGVFELTNNFKACSIKQDPFDGICINYNTIRNIINIEKTRLDNSITLYNELSTMTDISCLSNVKNIFHTKEDIVHWIQGNNTTLYKSFDLYRCFSIEKMSYVLLGVYTSKQEKLVTNNVLISFYDMIPLDVSLMFEKNNHWCLTFN